MKQLSVHRHQGRCSTWASHCHAQHAAHSRVRSLTFWFLTNINAYVSLTGIHHDDVDEDQFFLESLGVCIDAVAVAAAHHQGFRLWFDAREREEEEEEGEEDEGEEEEAGV